MSAMSAMPRPAVLISRGIACASGAAALLLAYQHLPWWLLVAIGLAASPRSWAPTALMVFVALVWLFQAELHPGLVTAPRLCALALALYYLHISSALAAVLPHDGHADPGLFRPWLARVGVVTALTIAVGLIVTSMESLVGDVSVGRGGWIAELAVGLTLATAGALFLMRLVRRG